MLKSITCFLFCLFAAQAAPAGPAPQLPDRLVVANSASWVPYSFLDQEGQPRGILVDLWRLFAEANNIEVEFKLVDWADSIELVRTGAAHLHGGLMETEARNEILYFFPTEIFRIRSLVFMREEIAFRDLAALTSVPVGVVTASAEEDFLRTNFSNLGLKAYPNSQQLVEAAVAGDIQVFVSDYPTGYYHLITLQALDQFDTGPTLFTRPIFAATQLGDSAILARIDAGTKKLSRREIQRVYRRWFIPKEPLPAWVVPTTATVVLLTLFTAVGLHFLALRRTIKTKTMALQSTVHELEAANARLDRLARTDALTNMPNRLAFFQIAPREIARASRYSRPLSLAILDLDHFKAVNDQYGHDAGDAALKHITQTVSAQLRPSDVFARIGGEEFAVVLPETEPQTATRLLERILEEVTRTPLRYEDNQIALSFSAGVTGFYQGVTIDTLIKHADVALYKCKAQGRSSVSLNLVTSPTT
jgi:diguanylate cyclase (GGDEF)-like protein